ncbi:hypothetical protein RPMA_07110 [Tardiphaga alba]|uniref:Replication protein n=1 Tax=Tardiphaga alba TaxID=340268 RepID=A0ABX8A7H3_9BRAD|nr:hypothetical protein [Tardiphaga alba]QUS38629.1 hypothetical protein RPMA_07110 [Tardiphaga alba]
MEKEKEQKRKEVERLRRVNFDHYEYSRHLRLNAERVKHYISSARCKHAPEEKEALLRDYLPCDAPFLSAANPEAWIRFKTIFSVHIREFTFDQKHHLVTFALREHVMSVENAKTFNLRRIKSWVNEMMRGFDFVAMVEIAPYTNFGEGTTRSSPKLSFHAHLITVGAKMNKLKMVASRINAEHSSFVPGCPAAHVEEISDLSGLARYLTKGATGEYRVWVKTAPKLDKTTGEIVEIKEFHQKSSPFARPSTQIAVQPVMRLHYIDRLTFAGGVRGNAALKRIRNDALSGLNRSQRSGRQNAFSGTFSVQQLPDMGWTKDWTYHLNRDELRREEKRPWTIEEPTPRWLALMRDWEWSATAARHHFQRSSARK